MVDGCGMDNIRIYWIMFSVVCLAPQRQITPFQSMCVARHVTQRRSILMFLYVVYESGN